MHRLAMILAAAFALTAADPSLVLAQAPATAEKMLAEYRNKNRVLLLFAPTASDPAFREQNKLWGDEQPRFKDRQLVVLSLLKDASTPKNAIAELDSATVVALAKKYNVDLNHFTVVLIGKDGHDAYRADKPVPPDALYEVIDAMPMRKAEMKRDKTARPDKAHDE